MVPKKASLRARDQLGRNWARAFFAKSDANVTYMAPTTSDLSIYECHHVSTTNPPIAHGTPRENRLFEHNLHGAADCRSKVPNPLLARCGDTSHESPAFAFPSMVNCLYLCDAPALSTSLAVALRSCFLRRFDCASCAARSSVICFAALTGKLGCHVRYMQVSWCTNKATRQHYGTTHPGASLALEWTLPCRARKSEGSWSLVCQSANRIRPVVASERMMGMQRDSCFTLAFVVAVNCPDMCALEKASGGTERHAASLHRLGHPSAPPQIARTGG
jgi:hypothetical protein